MQNDCRVGAVLRFGALPCERLYPLYPRGPRSGPGYAVPVPLPSADMTAVPTGQLALPSLTRQIIN